MNLNDGWDKRVFDFVKSVPIIYYLTIPHRYLTYILLGVFRITFFFVSMVGVIHLSVGV